MTKTEFFTMLANNNSLSKETREFAKQKLAKFTVSTTSTMTDIQRENELLKQEILYEMVEGEQYTICSMVQSLECCKDITVQKTSALVRQLVLEGKVIRKDTNLLRSGMTVVFILA